MAKFVLYKHKISEQYNKLKEISDIVSYSYKTNPMVGDFLIKMHKEDVNKSILWLSINSKYTMFKKNFDAPILFFMQGESKEEIKELLKKTDKFAVDNENDLNNLLEVAEEERKKITLFLRVKIREHTVNTGKYFVYGFKAERAKELLDELSGKNVDLAIHFHRKTQNVGEWYLKEDFEELFEGYLDKIKYVNIGGGVPWYYVNSKPNLEIIFNKIKEFKEWLNEKNIKLIIEPGRFIAAPAVDIESKVINVYDNNIVLDCSLFNAYIDTYLVHVRLPVEGEVEEKTAKELVKKGKEVYKYLIKGCTPDSLDIFRYKVFLPFKVKIGDKIILKNAGAYNFHCDFNDLPKLEYEIRD